MHHHADMIEPSLHPGSTLVMQSVIGGSRSFSDAKSWLRLGATRINSNMLTQFVFLDGNASATVVSEFMMSSAKMGYAFDFDCPQSIETLQNVRLIPFFN